MQATTIEQVLTAKRWMRLAMPDDLAQTVELARLDAGPEASPAIQVESLLYHMRLLRREIWDRKPTKAVKRPHSLRPSKRERRTGYRRNKQQSEGADNGNQKD